MDGIEEEIIDDAIDTGEGDGGEPAEPLEGEVTPAVEPDDPYSSKASREFSQWLKGLRDTGDPLAAKFARLAKDNHGQMFALRQLEKSGIDGVREKYALLDSIIHNDPARGELKGPDAIAAIQDTVRSYEELDRQIEAGNPAAIESMGEQFNGGLAKLAPVILDRIAATDKEAYAAAVLPHFVRALASSELLTSVNTMVEVLNEAPPSWLTAEQKSAWSADQQRKVFGQVGRMVDWLNNQEKKAADLAKGAVPGKGVTGKPDQLSQREADFNKREQDAHWNTNIIPKLDEHAGKSFNTLFAPYAKRLNLDAATTAGVKAEFAKRVAAAAMKEQGYSDQIKRYRGMKNPDPATVLNYARVNFDKHSKAVMDALVNERYKPFLSGKSKGGQPGNTNAAAPAGPPPAKGVQIVAVRPADGEIDHRARTLDQIHKKIFPLKNGKVVQLRA